MNQEDFFILLFFCVLLAFWFGEWMSRRRLSKAHEVEVLRIRNEYEEELRRLAPGKYPPQLEIGKTFVQEMHGIPCMCRIVMVETPKRERGTIQILGRADQ